MFRSGEIIIDEQRREVTVDGEGRHLEPQAFDLLVYLASHADRVIPKAELLDEVWGDQFVSEAALTTRVKEIRRALGDDGATQRLIRNFRGRGYRFVASLDRQQPARSTTLLGRDALLDQLDEKLTPGAIVTLVGAGGVGKTSIATEIARRWRDRRPDGTRVVRLAAVGEADDVVHALGIETGIDGTGDSFDTGIAALDALVVIDNAEHVVAAVAKAVDRIAKAGGVVRILATSRERLGVSAEQVVAVEPLDKDVAAQLFMDRAQAEHPDVEEPSDEQLESILALVDHLPLGIEMAAPHLATLGPEVLADTLRERGELLRTPDRSADERHQSLAALVDWSVRLLDPAVATTLTDLTVFAAPASLDDISAVLGRSAGELALTDLRELSSRSLIVVDTLRRPTTYRLLQTVRLALGPQRSATVDERHARFMATVAAAADDDLRRGDELLGTQRLDDVLPDLRVAHRWARANDLTLAEDLTASLYLYAQERQWSEPARWCRELGDDVVRAHPAFAAVVAAEAANQGDYDTSNSLGSIAGEAADPRVRAAGFDALSNTAMYTGDLAMTQSMGHAMLDLGTHHDDHYLRLVGSLAIVLGTLYAGEVERARMLLAPILDEAPERPTVTAWLRYTEGEIASAADDRDAAVASFEACIDAAERVGSRFVQGVAEVSRLSALAHSDDLARAAKAFVPVLRRYGHLRNRTHGITAIRNVITLLVRAGAHRTAMELVGALEHDDVKATYGAESEQLDAAVTTARGSSGGADVDTWIRAGARHDAEWAIDQAVAALETIAND